VTIKYGTISLIPCLLTEAKWCLFAPSFHTSLTLTIKMNDRNC